MRHGLRRAWSPKHDGRMSTVALDGFEWHPPYAPHPWDDPGAKRSAPTRGEPDDAHCKVCCRKLGAGETLKCGRCGNRIT